MAMKQVRFVNTDPESVRFMAREINILRRLDHPNVLKLEALVTSRMSSSLYLVFEYMDHDLAGLVGTPGQKFTEPQVCDFFSFKKENKREIIRVKRDWKGLMDGLNITPIR